ncbi:MAG: ROK family protein [Bryobacterales bacterium]|nr:ROK family protein [Bryobacterales bacterium]
MNVLAIDVGGSKVTLAVFEDGQMILRETHVTDRDGGKEWMVDKTMAVARSWSSRLRFDRCGIGFGGPVNYARQRVDKSTHVSGWDDFDFPAVVKSELGIPAIIDNDANVGALGEYTFGAGAHTDPMFYMTLSTGIGGGIIVNGALFRGADSFAGEIGHITIRPDGPQCLCGSFGCLERLCSGLWLEKDYGKTPKELLDDHRFVQKYVVDLAQGLKTCILLINPARVVIGGGISKAGKKLFDPLKAELRKQITNWSEARIDVVPACLADDSVLYGALALVDELGK